MGKKKNSKRQTQQRSASQSKSSQNNLVWIITGAALIILVVVSAFIILRQDTSKPVSVVADYPREISVDEAADKREQGAFILDVRQPEEWQEYHVPGSTLIPLDQLPNRLSEVPIDQEVVVVCRSGNRSQEGRDILLAANYPTVTSMTGGLKEWQSKGYETVSGP